LQQAGTDERFPHFKVFRFQSEQADGKIIAWQLVQFDYIAVLPNCDANDDHNKRLAEIRKSHDKRTGLCVWHKIVARAAVYWSCMAM
jgi:hypothetical protein